MTTVCVVQARFGSKRLPGKVLEPIGSAPMLVRVLDRLRRAATLDEIIVATTSAASDDAVAKVANFAGVKVVRGSQFDVLDRYHDALLASSSASVIVRVTADCPFIDPDLVDLVVRERADHNADFVANRLPPPHPRTYPVGLDVEVCTAIALDRAWREAAAPHHREHVMPYLYENPDLFVIRVLQLDNDLSHYRWTVDTVEDLDAVRRLDALVGPEPFGWHDVLKVAADNPRIGQINSAQRQKLVSEFDERWSE